MRISSFINGASIGARISTAETRRGSGRDPGRLFFPVARFIAVDCLDLVWGLGTLHCISQQQPAGRAEWRKMLGSWERCLRL